MTENLRAENDRLHAEIRSLNGALEGKSRVIVSLQDRIERLLAKVEELETDLVRWRG